MEKTNQKSVVQVILTRKFLSLFVAYILACLAYSCVASEFVAYGTNELGLDAVVVGAVASIVSMIGLFMRPVSSIIGDKINRKYLLIASYAGLALSSVILIFVEGSTGLWMAQIIRGISWNLQSCAGYLMVGEIVDKEDIGIAINVYSLAMVIASSFSAVMIMAIANSLGFTASFIATTIFASLAFLLTLSIPYEAPKKEGTLLDSIKSIRLHNLIAFRCLPIIVFTFGFQFISTIMGATWVLKFAADELNIMNAGIFATIANVIMYITKPVFGRVMDKIGCRWCVYLSCIGYILAMFVVSRANSMMVLYAGAAIYGVLCGGNAMAGRTMSMKLMPKDQQSVATMTVGYGNDLGISAANVVIPALAATLGTYRNVYLVFAGIAAVILVYAIIYGRIYLSRNPDNEMNW